MFTNWINTSKGVLIYWTHSLKGVLIYRQNCLKGLSIYWTDSLKGVLIYWTDSLKVVLIYGTNRLKESWIIVAATPIRWKLSESLHFHRRVCSFYWRAFSFHRRKSTIFMGFFSFGYLTGNWGYKLHILWVYKTIEKSNKNLSGGQQNHRRVQQYYSMGQQNHQRV